MFEELYFSLHYDMFNIKPVEIKTASMDSDYNSVRQWVLDPGSLGQSTVLKSWPDKKDLQKTRWYLVRRKASHNASTAVNVAVT